LAPLPPFARLAFVSSTSRGILHALNIHEPFLSPAHPLRLAKRCMLRVLTRQRCRIAVEAPDVRMIVTDWLRSVKKHLQIREAGWALISEGLGGSPNATIGVLGGVYWLPGQTQPMKVNR
jgi:hypothetical protein